MVPKEEAMPSWAKVILEKVEAFTLRVEVQSQYISNLKSLFSIEELNLFKVNPRPIEFSDLEILSHSTIRKIPQNEYQYNHFKVKCSYISQKHLSQRISQLRILLRYLFWVV